MQYPLKGGHVALAQGPPWTGRSLHTSLALTVDNCVSQQQVTEEKKIMGALTGLALSIPPTNSQAC